MEKYKTSSGMEFENVDNLINHLVDVGDFAELYDEFLDVTYDDFDIGNETYTASTILKQVESVYNNGYNVYVIELMNSVVGILSFMEHNEDFEVGGVTITKVKS